MGFGLDSIHDFYQVGSSFVIYMWNAQRPLLPWVVVLVLVFARSICMSLRRSFPKTRRSNTTYSTRESRPSTRERDRRGTFHLWRVEEWPFAMRKGGLFARRRRSCRLVWSWLRRYWRERRFLEYVWRNVCRLRVMSREQWYVPKSHHSQFLWITLMSWGKP